VEKTGQDAVGDRGRVRLRGLIRRVDDHVSSCPSRLLDELSIVGRALDWVPQDGVGGVDLLHPLAGVARGRDVRVVLLRQASVGGLDDFRIGLQIHLQDLIPAPPSAHAGNLPAINGR
jgi:hypothetical protein